MHLAPLIRDLAVILALAAVVALIFRKIRQPLVLGYVTAGMLVGPQMHSLHIISDLPNIRVWADLGVIFLMFTIGLDFSFRRLARVGISAFLAAVLEVTGMLAVGYGLGRAMGWKTGASLLLGMIVAMSSTTIIFKTLDELRLRSRRFSERIVSMLIVEDLLAILMLAALSTLATADTISGIDLLLSAGKLLFVVGSWFLFGYFWVPQFVKYVGRVGNDEMLTILSLGLCLSLVVIASKLQYSVALGAFIMGSILAESTESQRIEELMRPLRDLFLAVFFVSVGLLVDPRIFLTQWKLIALISLTVVGGKLICVTLASLITGQTLRTSVQVAFGMTQIGEFSFILAGLGVLLGYGTETLYPVVVAVSILTTLLTPIFIRRSHKIAVKLETSLPLKAKTFINQYSAWAQQRSADLNLRREFYNQLLKWVMNGVAVSVVFIAVSDLSLRLDSYLPSIHLSSPLSWVIALVLSSPFLWGMFTVFQGVSFNPSKDRESLPQGGTLFLSRVLSLFWVGALSTFFITPLLAIFGTLGFAGFTIVIFHRRLENSYRWFESQFLSAFQVAKKTKRNLDPLRHLAPWDAHLIRIKVHPNSEFSGRTLEAVRFRSDFGLNVVAIQRGTQTLIAPGKEEWIFPKDELLVLGTDEQIERVRLRLERPPGLGDRFRDLGGYELVPVTIEEESPLKGKRIRDSRIREICGGMVVGVERADERLINPDSDLVLNTGDVLYVVGDTELLKKLASYLAP